ncbi:Response regulator receiver protein [Candidatus Sulfopaludibacter sp. SbA4]|nr:Response regulator receiver protein [Candidatus Sulfopaludibacter sp. SbA4]
MALPFEGTTETILLVEDHSALLKLVKQILEDANFTVIPASSVKEAVQLEADYPGTIDLLLSDVRMKNVSGPNLAKRLKERRPQMRVMLMSGYPGGALLVLNYGWYYIEKPFIPSVLVSKIKDVLRGETREQAADRFDTLKEPRRSFRRLSLDLHRPTLLRARRGA